MSTSTSDHDSFEQRLASHHAGIDSAQGRSGAAVAERIERRAVTLREVAEASGVSISTVSRILDDRIPQSRSSTAERVRQTADALGYRRNAAASGLRRGATGTIGVLVPRLTDTVMALMFEALERAARTRGYFAVVATSGDEPEEERRATETLLDRGVDAVILATARLGDLLPASLRDRGIPHVLVLRSDGVSPSSLGDDEMGGYLAVRHLVDLGHRDIAVVTGPDFTSSARARLAGALRATIEAGWELPPGRVIAGGYGVDDGVAAGEALFAAGDAPTAVFAANDNIALGVARSGEHRRTADRSRPLRRRLQRHPAREQAAGAAQLRESAVRSDRNDGVRAAAIEHRRRRRRGAEGTADPHPARLHPTPVTCLARATHRFRPITPREASPSQSPSPRSPASRPASRRRSLPASSCTTRVLRAR